MDRNIGQATSCLLCVSAVGLLGALLAASHGASAQTDEVTKMVEISAAPAGAFEIDDSDPERSVPSAEQAMKRPLHMGYFVMQLIERAQRASDREDYKSAVKYSRALVKAVPERGTAYGMLCRAYESLGDMDSALDACRTALGKAGVTVQDNVRFVELALRGAGPLEPKAIEDVEAVVAHLEKELASDAAGWVTAYQLRCSLAARMDDTARLEACTSKLRELAPKDPRTIAYAFALQLKKRDFASAAGVITQAQRLGLPTEATDKMEAALRPLRDEARPWPRWLANWGLVGGLSALLACVAGAFAWSRRKRLLPGATRPQTHLT